MWTSTVYCVFDPLVGWRIRLISQKSKAYNCKIMVVPLHDGTKALRLSGVNTLKLLAGRFCNPRKILNI